MKTETFSLKSQFKWKIDSKILPKKAQMPEPPEAFFVKPECTQVQSFYFQQPEARLSKTFLK